MCLVSLKATRLGLIFLLPILLAACSSGGGTGGVDGADGAGGAGGAGGTGTTVPEFSFGQLVGGGTAIPVIDIFSKDLNGDDIDEVIIVGRMSQPTTSWQNFNMQVYGWNTGSFANETTTWLPGGINEIIGSEPDVKFADFDNADSDNDMTTGIDMLVTASTDSDDYDSGTAGNQRAETILFKNTGAGAFTKTTLSVGNPWTHGSVIDDIDGDNDMDIILTDYGTTSNVTLNLNDGSANFTTYTANFSASSVSVGEFDSGNPGKELVFTDAAIGAGKYVDDTVMYGWSVAGSTLTLSQRTVLPGSLFTNAQIDAETTQPYTTSGSHAIRNIAFDFDGDTNTDIIVFERLSNSSKVQFLKSDGAGGFTDVTSSKLVDYNGNNGGVNYQPVLIDVDNDADMDIFLSGTDYDGSNDQTQLLINDAGTFTSTYAANFSADWEVKKTATTNANTAGQNQHIVKGPSNNYFIVAIVLYEANGSTQVGVFITNIGTIPSEGVGTIDISV